jgi:hypothetical protein
MNNAIAADSKKIRCFWIHSMFVTTPRSTSPRELLIQAQRDRERRIEIVWQDSNKRKNIQNRRGTSGKQHCASFPQSYTDEQDNRNKEPQRAGIPSSQGTAKNSR